MLISSKSRLDLGAPLRNRTVDLLLTMGSHHDAVIDEEPLTSQNASSRKLAQAVPGGGWPGFAPRVAPHDRHSCSPGGNVPLAAWHWVWRQNTPAAFRPSAAVRTQAPANATRSARFTQARQRVRRSCAATATTARIACHSALIMGQDAPRRARALTSRTHGCQPHCA
jgi:hypothetical protein